jgi:hypothetical protein
MIKEIINEFNPMSISIEINKHKEYYESVVSFLDEKQLKYISKDILDEMINRNTIVKVCCYPITPIGFYDIFHYDLDIALELMYNALKDE